MYKEVCGEVFKKIEEMPLADRLETAIIDVLHRKIKISFDDILQEIFIKFPNSLTPDTQSIKEILREYADTTKDGKWILKPVFQGRESAHSWMIYVLADLGKKADFNVWIGQKEQGEIVNGKKLSEYCFGKILTLKNMVKEKWDRIKQIDVIWHKGKEIYFTFEIENTTAITEAIVRGSNIAEGTVKRFIIIPEERERMLHKKLQDPLIKANLKESNWKFIFYKDLEKYYENAEKKKSIDADSISSISRDPQKPDHTQLKLF